LPPRFVRVEDAVADLAHRATVGRRPALLAALSGIEASGKSVVAGRIAVGLQQAGLRVAPIALDPWHQPASVRFAEHDPAATFYRNAFRFEELFERLVEPLRRDRAIELEARLLDLPADATYAHTYRYENVDVILLEGIFLLRRDLRPRYDWSLWIECPLEVALARALRRNQEGKALEQLRADYERIYFPARRLHLALDEPAAHADLVLENH